MDQDWQNSGSDLDQNCLQIVNCRQRVNMGVDFSEYTITENIYERSPSFLNLNQNCQNSWPDLDPNCLQIVNAGKGLIWE